MSPTERHALLDCFVLHRRDYGNSSLLLEVFSRAEGRFPVLAKGAKRQRNAPAALLQLFTPLLIAVSGRGEVKTMIQLEPAAAAVPLTGAGLYCGFYLNELLMIPIKRYSMPISRRWRDWPKAMIWPPFCAVSNCNY